MPILDRLDHQHRARAIEGELPFYSFYTVGIAGERFFRALKEEGRILGTICASCGVSYVPGRLYCERCFAHLDDDAWFDAGTIGAIHTFTVLHVGLDGSPLATPRVVAFVKIGDTDGGLVHDLGQVDPQAVSIGTRVEAVFKAPEERTGSISDIIHFRPAD